MIKLVELTKNDIDKILDLEAQSALQLPVYYPYDREALDSYIFQNKDAKAYGAFDGDKLVGWSAFSCREKSDGTDKGFYEMCGIVVDAKYRRQGIGKKLFNIRLQELLKKEAVIKIYATNYPKNIPILLLYLTNGFVVYDYKKDVYGPGGDRVYVKYDKLEKDRT
jgi:ribosomal protein S18 acetylase RimI-like enzyme